MTNFIFITGGVISGIGKGITTASIGALLEGYGYKNITIKKLDPYLNVDPGTMNPFQHGEVYVTEDGLECDLDLGHYERFTNIKVGKNNNITSGRIFLNLLQKERKGEFLGQTIQCIPHVTNEIKNFILHDADKYDFVLCEIGGSIGDYEAGMFYESIRQIKNEYDNVCFVHVTWIPFLKSSNEFKTKPTQNTCKQLMFHGIQPDFLVCRSDNSSREVFKKISRNTNVKLENIIDACNVDNVYKIPSLYSKQNLGKNILKQFGLDIPKLDLSKWYIINGQFTKNVSICIVGKYIGMADTYKSLVEAIYHSSLTNKVNVDIKFIDSRKEIDWDIIKSVNGIIIPGGFGTDGIENKIQVIKYARENKIPILGICLGCQLMVIEFCRNVVGYNDSTSREFSENGTFVVDLLEDDKKLGGTMRLGNYEIELEQGTLAYKIYNKRTIIERHRHRYEIINKYMKSKTLICSGYNKSIPEIIEIKGHQFYLGVQFHPEYNSRFNKSHPIFDKLINSIQIYQ